MQRILLLAVLLGCSSDVGVGMTPRSQRAPTARFDDAGMGLDPGLALTAPVTDFALAGASIPRPGGGDLLLGFVAFVTAAAADDGDGNGTALDRTMPPPTDGNGASDVYLAAVVSTERAIGGRPQPTAFVQGIAPIMRDPRCTRCHGFHYPGGFRVAGHKSRIPAGSNAGCEVCHSDGATLVPGVAPRRIVWLAPDPQQVRNPTQDFRGKTDRQLFDLVMTESEPADHLKNDDKILWALAHGQVPFRGLAPGGRVPIDPQQWQDLIDAWDAGGQQFSTGGAVRDVVLVSRRDSAASSGDGASLAPAIAYLPNPAYVPTDPAAAPAGWVRVAFASDATDLVAGAASPNRDVFRAVVAVNLDANLDVDLVFDATSPVLCSVSTAGARGGDADSDAPAINQDGRFVAFESRARDLVAGFTDGNAVDQPDVFLRDVVAATTTLQSRSAAAATTSGDGPSRRPSITPTDAVVAFESDAADLVAGDTNNLSDIYYARDPGPGVVVARASGFDATFAASTRPSVWFDAGSGDVVVAFESTQNNVAGVFVHRNDGTTMSTTRISGTAAVADGRPQVAPDGALLAFTAGAGDLEPSRPDANQLADVFVLDLAGFRSTGAVALRRRSLAATGADADGASRLPRIGGFRTLGGALLSDLLLGFRTDASNVGRSPNTDLVLQFALDRTNPRTIAEFSGAPRMGTAPLTVRFNDLSSNAASWSWDFGDGAAPSTERNPTHTYNAVGSFAVSLTVTGPGGMATNTKPGYVTVAAQPPTWTEVFDDHLTGCVGCHTGPRNSSTFSMADRMVAYDNLVGVGSVVCVGRQRVVAGSSAASMILETLSGTGCHANHTGGNRGPQTLQDLRDWIDAGALNN